MMIKENAMQHGINLSIDLDGVPEVIHGDERKLKQVMYNLLSNAVKFTPDDGEIHLSAGWLSSDSGHLDKVGKGLTVHKAEDDSGTLSPEDYVKITVRDSGMGIKREDLKRIFHAFEQGDNSAKRRFKGTGLGLSLTRELVEIHGGKIWAESEGEGKGSRFHFAIPMIRDGEARAAEFREGKMDDMAS